jgi:hypothetical protein
MIFVPPVTILVKNAMAPDRPLAVPAIQQIIGLKLGQLVLVIQTTQMLV